MSKCIRCGEERGHTKTVFCLKTQGGIAHEFPLENLYTGQTISDQTSKRNDKFGPNEHMWYRRMPAKPKLLPFPLPSCIVAAQSAAVCAGHAQVIMRPVALVVAPKHAEDFSIEDITVGCQTIQLSMQGSMRGDMFPPIPDPDKIKAVAIDFPTMQTGQAIVFSIFNKADVAREFSAMLLCLYVDSSDFYPPS